MIERRLHAELKKVAARRRSLQLWSSLAAAWAVAATLAALLLWRSTLNAVVPSWGMPLLIGGAAAAFLFIVWRARRTGRDLKSAASRIEARHPELNSALLTAMQQQPEYSMAGFGYLQNAVIERAVAHSRRKNWVETVPSGRLVAARLAHFFSAAALVLMVAALLSRPMDQSARSLASTQGLDAAAAESGDVTVEPGDTEIERNTSLLVLARFAGRVPPEATLVYGADDGKEAEPQTLAMAQSLDDPLFAGRLSQVASNVWYRVEFSGGKSDDYHVSVFDYPKLERADALLEFPEYTQMSPRTVEDVRRVTAVEGTKLTLSCRVNKPLEKVELVDKEDETQTLALTPHPDDPLLYEAQITLDKSQRMTLRMADDRQRQNKAPEEFVFNVSPNQPPDLKFALPARDVEVSPLEELTLKATMWDDFGVSDYGVSYALAGKPPVEVAVGNQAAAREKHEFEHLVNFESLQAEPDQLVSYYLWAEDVGPDGQARRTMSDMFFAEVRHFEEIFRQGQQPPGGQQQQQQQGQQGQNAQQAEELAELQKQIVSATWKLIRRETDAEPTKTYLPDVRLVGESQQTAIEQAEALAEKLQDEQSRGHLQQALRHMQTAVGELVKGVTEESTKSLPAALSAEQAAYQALLKLRAREHQVIRGSQSASSSGRSGGSNRSQQQLQQLQLDNNQNRYETERQASSPQEQQEQENRQALSRLRELARRQEDLNKQLQALQAALEEARTEQEKEEVRKQLKRLREQQQDVLRDIDELQQRMERPENQQQMAEASEQLDQARSNVRQSSEALEQGQTSQALASGRRASRQFEELREEFRRRAAGEFSDQMQEMRREARQIDEKQNELAEQMEAFDDQKQPTTLRDSGNKQQVAEELRRQEERVGSLLDEMREVTQQAEPSEPLLAQELYDSWRKANQQQIADSLRMSSELLDRGFDPQAAEAQELAGDGIEELRKGVERAAESVLGDEAEALRRAQDELDELAEQLGDEIARQAPELAPDVQPNQANRNGEGAGQPSDRQQDSQRAQGGGRPSEDENGEERRGQDAQDEQDEQSGEPRQGGQGGQPQNDDGQNEDRQNGEGRNAERPSNGQGRQPGQSQNESEGGQQGQQDSPGQRGEGQPAGESSSPSQQGGQAQGGQGRSGDPNRSQQGGRNQPGLRSNENRNDNRGGFGGLGAFWSEEEAQAAMPLSGEGFQEWSDRLRDVEEMLDDPSLRADAARIRDRAKAIRGELKRHSKTPSWDLVRDTIFEPMQELQRQISDELLRRSSQHALAPVDRDPVPIEFAEQVRKYYERLGDKSNGQD